MTKPKDSERDDSYLVKIQAFVSSHVNDMIRSAAQAQELPISRVIAYALDRESQMELPFQVNFSLPRESGAEYEFADEAGRIIDFMKRMKKPQGIDVFLLHRHAMGIPNADDFLAAFKECVELNQIEAVVPKPSGHKRASPYPEGYMHYQMPDRVTKRKEKSRSKRYAEYERLKKEFEE